MNYKEYTQEYVEIIVDRERDRNSHIICVWLFLAGTMTLMSVWMFLRLGFAYQGFLPLFAIFAVTFAILAGLKQPGVPIHKMLWRFYQYHYFFLDDYDVFKIRPTLNNKIGIENYYLIGGRPLVVVCKSKEIAVLARLVV